jgi:hypothetical protein
MADVGDNWMNDRAKALKWWRTFNQEDREYLAKKVFPDKSFIEVDTSSNMIEKVWRVILPCGG